MVENCVLGPGSAMVDGVKTGLAGCSTKSCVNNCLRKDPGLGYQYVSFSSKEGDSNQCQYFIPTVTLS